MGMFFLCLMDDEWLYPFRLPRSSAIVAPDETMTITKFCNGSEVMASRLAVLVQSQQWRFSDPRETRVEIWAERYSVR